MVGRIVVVLAVMSVVMQIGGCRQDSFNGRNDVVLVRVKSNGVLDANDMPLDSVCGAKRILQLDKQWFYTLILLPDKGSLVGDMFHAMGLFAAAGAPDFYMRTRLGTLINVSYSPSCLISTS